MMRPCQIVHKNAPSLHHETLPESEAVAMALQWVHLGYVRHTALAYKGQPCPT
jgi:hypothetical protein